MGRIFATEIGVTSKIILGFQNLLAYLDPINECIAVY
jgi:hypothetical protein